MSYDRYNKLRMNGTVKEVPFIKIPVRSTDYYTNYIAGKTRLDILSFEYYNDPNYGWLIMQANPQFGALEFRIPNMALLRIPYPLNTVLTQYANDIDNYKEIYGIE